MKSKYDASVYFEVVNIISRQNVLLLLINVMNSATAVEKKPTHTLQKALADNMPDTSLVKKKKASSLTKKTVSSKCEYDA